MWELYRDEEINTNFNDLEAGCKDVWHKVGVQ